METISYGEKSLTLDLREYSPNYYEVSCYGAGHFLFSRGFRTKERALVFFDQKVAEIRLLETWWSTYE